MSMILDGSNGVTFNDSSLQGAAASPYVLKNRIINGDMRIDQRNAGAAGSTSTYTVDRFGYFTNQAGKFNWQQNAGAVTPPTGFTNYLGFTSTSAFSIGASDYFNFYQVIEGFNLADLGWGTANAKTVTLSFQVRSSLTGTFGGFLINGSDTRAYTFSYTIPTANTWTTISVTIAGDTSGTWASTNTAGVSIYWSLGAGSSLLGTGGTWGSTINRSVTGQVNVSGTNGATFYITGVQLEQNTSATPFERRLYGQELINCLRYYEKSYDIGTSVGAATSNGQRVSSGNTGTNTTGEITTSCEFSVKKRIGPTVVIYDAVGNAGKCTRTNIGVGNFDNEVAASVLSSENNVFVYSNTGTNAGIIRYHFTASAEL